MAKEPDIANPYDYDRNSLFLMWFGAYGSTKVYVWADHLEGAFDEAVEWLDNEGLCGAFVTVTRNDIIAAAKELGKEKGWSRQRVNDAIEDIKEGDFDGDAGRALEEAETDLSIISHTTLPNCEKKIGGPLYIPNWEWGADEVYRGSKEYEEILAESEEIAEED